LERKYNLTFFEYKISSNYSTVPREIPSSFIGVLLYPILPASTKRPFRRSRDYLKPRSDSEEVWHARAGYLGPRALRILVYHARNVEIKGTARVKCEHYATVHAANVVFRRSSENVSPRPCTEKFSEISGLKSGGNESQA
jgi:hypothetical protein